jgi:hypothetical protein
MFQVLTNQLALENGDLTDSLLNEVEERPRDPHPDIANATPALLELAQEFNLKLSKSSLEMFVI